MERERVGEEGQESLLVTYLLFLDTGWKNGERESGGGRAREFISHISSIS